MQTYGKHIIMDAWECNDRLNSVEEIEAALREAVVRSRATLVELVVHPFSPHGASGVAVIAESHIAVHTWPEERYFSLDVYTCGEKTVPEAAVEVFKARFQPKRVQIVELPRGRWPLGDRRPERRRDGKGDGDGDEEPERELVTAAA